MLSTSVRGVTVKVETMVEAMVAKAKARVNIDLNQKAEPQVTVPTVAPVNLPRGARHLGRNATIATKKAIFFQYCRSKQCGCCPIPNKI